MDIDSNGGAARRVLGTLPGYKTDEVLDEIDAERALAVPEWGLAPYPRGWTFDELANRLGADNSTPSLSDQAIDAKLTELIDAGLVILAAGLYRMTASGLDALTADVEMEIE